MSAPLQLRHEANRCVEIVTGGGALLWRYVYRPDTPANESPRPYAHPVQTLEGDRLTNFRPNDHPWHHALSMTVTSVDGVNFWGGPSYRADEGYRWRDDHGTQVHREWTSLKAERLEEIVEWRARQNGEMLLEETRVMETRIQAADDPLAGARGEGGSPGGRPGKDGLLAGARSYEQPGAEARGNEDAIVGARGYGWSLRWTSELRNVSGRALTLGNYHAVGGLGGSHYTGLQFRGARELLDEHGDAQIGIVADGGLVGETAVHGAEARWMEWTCQHDGSLRRTRIRFENFGGPLPWFVRAKNPVAAFAFHREQAQALAVGATLRLDHALTFTPA